MQTYQYDKRGQLLAVVDSKGQAVEKYVYDRAGNILEKTVNSVTTAYTYDKANQLVSSTVEGKVTSYRYDAAGRLVKEGDKSYRYGYLDKVLAVYENDENTANFDYHLGGQISAATRNGETENFTWDGLALIHRGSNTFINEPYVTGGNPLLSSKGGVMFNDMLGSTLGVNGKQGVDAISMTAFGETENKSAFFTGKPAVGELGYAFLFRNYRAEQGKWQTADPLGYPDGWNNLAYCGNGITSRFDSLGGQWGNLDFIAYYYRISGPDWIDTDVMGLTGDIWSKIFGTILPIIKDQIYAKIKDIVTPLINAGTNSGHEFTTYTTLKGYSFGDICFSLGGGLVGSASDIEYAWTKVDQHWEFYIWNSITFSYSDTFKDPLDIEGVEPFGTIYSYGHTWAPYSYYDAGWIYE